jgi:hypothetical protein
MTNLRKTSPIAGETPQTRSRSIVNTMLLIALGVLIVRDILVKRWGSPPVSDVTRRLP